MTSSTEITTKDLLDKAADAPEAARRLEEIGLRCRKIENAAKAKLPPETSDAIAKAVGEEAVPDELRRDFLGAAAHWHSQQVQAMLVTSAAWNELRQREERYAAQVDATLKKLDEGDPE